MKIGAGIIVASVLLVPTAAHAADDPPARWYVGQRGFSAKLQAGPVYRRLFRADIVAADLSASFGALTKYGGWYGLVDGLLGATDQGLTTWQTRLGGSWQMPVDRFHIGAGLDLGIIAVYRATTSNAMSTITFGGKLFADCDLVKGRNQSLYLGITLKADAWPDADDSQPMLGVGAQLGVRFH